MSDEPPRTKLRKAAKAPKAGAAPTEDSPPWQQVLDQFETLRASQERNSADLTAILQRLEELDAAAPPSLPPVFKDLIAALSPMRETTKRREAEAADLVKRLPLEALFALNLRNARNELRLTQRALAKLANISATRIAVIESAGGNVKLETISRLAKELGMEPYQLLMPNPPRR